jgi:hypothetical protein
MNGLVDIRGKTKVNTKRLYEILSACTVQLRKGAEIEEHTEPSGLRVKEIFAMPHESEALPTVEKVDMVFLTIGVDKAEAEKPLRTCLVSAIKGLSGLPAAWSEKAITSGRCISTLRPQGAAGGECASFGWPTPTAKANHDSPSMRKWPAYTLYQDTAGRTTPRLWEWMMGFPAGWTDCGNLETPSPPTPPKSSDEQSCTRS